MNKWFGIGRLTRDPELRYTPSGAAVVNFRIATDDGKDKEGNKLTAFVDCEAWNGTAEIITKYFKQGKPIAVEARLKNDEWEDKNDGSKRSRLKAVLIKFEFVPKDSTNSDVDADSESAEEATKPPPKNKTQVESEPESEEYDDDIPF